MKLNYLTLSVLAAASLSLTACGDSAEVTSSTSGNAPTSTASAANSANNGGDQVSAQARATAESAQISVDSDFDSKASYAIGASVGTYVATIQKEQQQFIGNINRELIIKGFIESLDGKTTLSDDEITSTLVSLDNKVRDGMEKQLQKDAADNLAAGKAFLEQNAKKEGVKVTPSGLQYEIIKEGTGKSPSPTDSVSVKYKGTTIDGTVFDEQTDPIEFPLSQIIPGWIEGLQLMKEGGQARLYIPSELAYGEMSTGDVIKPNSVLIFDVELVEVISAN